MGLVALALVAVALVWLAMPRRAPRPPPPEAPLALPRRAFYCLVVSYDFDGGRATSELFAFRTLSAIRSTIEQVLLPTRRDLKAHVLVQFSTLGGRASARLFTVDDGVVTGEVALTPALVVALEGARHPLAAARTEAEAERLASGVLALDDFDGLVRALPPLSGARLGDGEESEVTAPGPFAATWPDTDFVQHGFTDLMCPEDPAVEFVAPPDV